MNDLVAIRGVPALLLVGMSFGLVGCGRPAVETIPDAPPGTVKVEIDGDPIRSFVLTDVEDGTTVAEVMRQVADRHADELEITLSGTGSMTLLESIDDQGLDGGTGWLYEVDGEFANVGIGAMELSPPATIRWRYGKMAD